MYVGDDKNHYNQTPGGDFNPMKVPDIAAKISGENNPAKLPKVRAKMSKAHKGKKLSEETRKKMSKAKSSENNPMYDKEHTLEIKEKISSSKNTTGYFRVSKTKNPQYKQGFMYMYQYYDNNKKRHKITSVDIKKLEQKVKAKGLEWFKLDDNNGE